MAKNKDLHERHQAILSKLLKDEDNRYCVDCDAKGPRWASWNLGIFLCIRCAGIHRNLGVHISKVKSINLDTWTPEQIASVEDMGNSRARAVYEANLPDNYKRPTSSDQAMEQFIRAKYEHKRYIAKEWVPSAPRTSPSNYQDVVEEKKKEKKTNVKPVISIPGAAAGTTKSKESTTSPDKPANLIQANGTATPFNVPSQTSQSNDLLGDLLLNSNIPMQPAPKQKLASEDLFATFSSPEPHDNTPQTNAQQSRGDTSASQDLFNVGEKTQSTKDSIMALYGNTPTNPAMLQGFNTQGSFAQPQTGMMNQGVAYTGMNMGYTSQAPLNNPGMVGGMYRGPIISNPQQAMMTNQQVGMVNQPMMVQQSMMGYYGAPQQPMQAQQLQQQQIYANQLQSQMANITLNQPQLTIQPHTAQASNSGGISQGSTQANGQTLNFDLWN